MWKCLKAVMIPFCLRPESLTSCNSKNSIESIDHWSRIMFGLEPLAYILHSLATILCGPSSVIKLTTMTLSLRWDTEKASNLQRCLFNDRIINLLGMEDFCLQCSLWKTFCLPWSWSIILGYSLYYMVPNRTNVTTTRFCSIILFN